MTTDPDGGPDAARNAEGEPPEVTLPSFPRRVLDTFVAPNRLGEALRDHPAWAAAMLTGAVLMVLQMALIPADVWEAMLRQLALARGTKIPEGVSMVGITRIFATVGAGFGYLIFILIVAGLMALLFAFIFGDEGRYKQYLAIVSHAWLISAFLGLLTVPLKIVEKNPQATLSLGTFFYFLSDGYWHRVLNMLDLTQVWAWLVVAAGIHAVDSRRSFKSAAVTLIVLDVCLALIFAIFVRTP